MKSVFRPDQRLTRIVNFRVTEARYQRLQQVREQAHEMSLSRDWFQAAMDQALERICRDAERELADMAERSAGTGSGAADG